MVCLMACSLQDLSPELLQPPDALACQAIKRAGLPRGGHRLAGTWRDQGLVQPDASKALRLPLLCAGVAAQPGAERSPLAEMPLSLRHSLSTPPSVTSAAAPLRPYPSPPEPQVCSPRAHCAFSEGTHCSARLVHSLHCSAPWALPAQRLIFQAVPQPTRAAGVYTPTPQPSTPQNNVPESAPCRPMSPHSFLWGHPVEAACAPL